MKTPPWLLLALATLAPGLPVSAATPQQIDQAIDKGTAYLLRVQKDNHWEFAPEFHVTPKDNGSNRLDGGDWGGLTAMATHALLVAGVNPNDPKLRPTIDLLLKWPMRMTPYALCQRDQVLELLPRRPEVKDVAIKDGIYLEKSLRTAGDAAGLYYYFPGKDGAYDHSVSQYGVLAMWACGESGFEVSPKYWEAIERAWQHHQEPDGGWSYTYNPKGGGSASMTAAGVATLFITQDYLHSMEGLDCHGNITNPAIDKGMAWMAAHFDDALGSGWNPYTLYGVERIGVAGGYKYFGTRDWFKEGADWFMRTQNADGSWGAGGWLAGYNNRNIPATCFAMFFLTRGRAPVAFNKARYEVVAGTKHEEARWNQRPRDIAKITTWVEKQTERNLNWHVVSLESTSADQLQDAPILYLAGDRKLDLSPEDEAKLKQYVEDGGLILGNPDGNNKAFIDSFRALGAKLFPAYEMRPLPPDHPIYQREQFRSSDIHKKDTILGLSNGVRELMLIPTYDWGKSWQGDAFSKEDSFRLAANLYLYSIGRSAFHNGESQIVRPDPAIKAAKTLKMARLDYSGNADPEPGGWRRVAAVLHNSSQLDLDVQTVKLGEGKLNKSAAPPAPHPTADAIRATATKRITPEEFQSTGGDPAKMQALVNAKVQLVQAEVAAEDAKRAAAQAAFKFAHLTGTAKFTWTDAQRDELKTFLNNGGVLLVDSAGASQPFADAFEKEMVQIFPAEGAQISEVIPATDPLYQGFKPALKPDDWNYRRFVREGEKRPLGPELKGIKLHGRWAVLFSRRDISNALVGRDVDGVIGYSSDTATTLVVNLLQKFDQ
jgi:hypothetical protein